MLCSTTTIVVRPLCYLHSTSSANTGTANLPPNLTAWLIRFAWPSIRRNTWRQHSLSVIPINIVAFAASTVNRRLHPRLMYGHSATHAAAPAHARSPTRDQQEQQQIRGRSATIPAMQQRSASAIPGGTRTPPLPIAMPPRGRGANWKPRTALHRRSSSASEVTVEPNWFPLATPAATSHSQTAGLSSHTLATPSYAGMLFTFPSHGGAVPMTPSTGMMRAQSHGTIPMSAPAATRIPTSPLDYFSLAANVASSPGITSPLRFGNASSMGQLSGDTASPRTTEDPSDLPFVNTAQSSAQVPTSEPKKPLKKRDTPPALADASGGSNQSSGFFSTSTLFDVEITTRDEDLLANLTALDMP